MKRYLLAILILLSIPTVSFAGEKWEEKCAVISNLAYVIMEARQNGAPMQKIMEKVVGTKIYERMVFEAYETPRFNTEEYQTDAENDFRDRWYLLCSKNLSEGK